MTSATAIPKDRPADRRNAIHHVGPIRGSSITIVNVVPPKR